MSDNPISMEYHELSKKSFESVNDIIEIVPFEAITPHHPDFEEHESKYNWQHLLSHDSKRNTKKFDKPHSPTERAGMCSHWELIRQRSLTDEPFFVTEHDTYLRPEREETFRLILELSEDYNLHYTNMGLFMGCYSLSRIFAEQATILLNKDFPINGGPYACMERLFKTFLRGSQFTEPFEKTKEYDLSENTFLHNIDQYEWPLSPDDGLRFGKTDNDIFDVFNAGGLRQLGEERFHNFNPHLMRPTTQMIKRSLGEKSVTQHHQAYRDDKVECPWKRQGDFHFID